MLVSVGGSAGVPSPCSSLKVNAILLLPFGGPDGERSLSRLPFTLVGTTRHTAGVGITLEGTDLRDQVRAILERHREEVSELVNSELSRMVDELVAERLAAGNGTGPVVASAETNRDATKRAPAGSRTSGTQQCRSCGEVKPAAAFARQRRVCRVCRQRQEHERKARRDRLPEATRPNPFPVA
jgi:hypothetical protein